MDIYLKRMQRSENGVSGFIVIDGVFNCFSLELPDKGNRQKVSCIPRGKYEIKFREEPTEMTMRYRTKYDWFNYHLMLINVKDRSGIYIHIGNSVKDTYGCILTGKQINTDLWLSNSRKAFRPFYSIVSTALRKDEKVTITIE